MIRGLGLSLPVAVGEGSRWLVSKTSYLTGLHIADGAAVLGAGGKPLTLIVDGARQPLAPGDYKGGIVLQVGG